MEADALRVAEKDAAWRPWRRLHCVGISLPEVLLSIAIIGILLAVALPRYQGTVDASQAVVARNLAETLNQAVHRYGQVNGELVYSSIAMTANDEMTVLRQLQWRNPDNPKPGSPYMRPDWNPDTSNSVNEYRLQWNGTLFSLLPPGTAGAGLKVKFDGSDITTPWVFPAGYKPGGR